MLRYAMIGGVGGLAPIGCQALALFLPNLIGGQSKFDQAIACLPQTVEQLIVSLIVLCVVFAIAAAVVYVTLEKDGTRSLGKAFLLGVSVPGMILSLANGTSTALKSADQQAYLVEPSQNRQTSLSSTQIGDHLLPVRYESWESGLTSGIMISNTNNSISSGGARVLVGCPACPNDLDPSSLVTVVSIGLPDGSATLVHLPQDVGSTGWIPISATATPEKITFSIPGHFTASNENKRIWEGSKTHFSYRRGEKWDILVTLRPGIWNNIFALLDAPQYFNITSVVARPLSSAA